MTKVLFLSFNDKFIRPLLYGMKKYEYRKRFCDEDTICYLYLSGKTRKVIGLLELGKTVRIDKIVNDYQDENILKRLNNYIEKREINALPIKSFKLADKFITLDEIRNKIDGFNPPQMYYVVDNNPKLKEILNEMTFTEEIINHDHTNIYEDNIAVSVKDMEKTLEFKKLDEENIILKNRIGI